MAEGVKGVNLESDEVNGSGDWSFERGHYRLDGTRGSETGSYVLFIRKSFDKCIYIILKTF